jgi:ATPase subunit of ABC transporter with duplicated ATPase domains
MILGGYDGRGKGRRKLASASAYICHKDHHASLLARFHPIWKPEFHDGDAVARKQYQTKLDAPYLKQVTLQPDKVQDGYPFNLPWLQEPSFELIFDKSVTIIVGENGVGKSTRCRCLANHQKWDHTRRLS